MNENTITELDETAKIINGLVRQLKNGLAKKRLEQLWLSKIAAIRGPKNIAFDVQSTQFFFGLSSRNGKNCLTVAAPTKDSPEYKAARKLQRVSPVPIKVIRTGNVISSYRMPRKKVLIQPQANSVPDLQPGRSISHFNSGTGSLTLLVDLDTKQGRTKGFITPLHVVRNNGGMKQNDDIHSPGREDEPPTLRSVVGRIYNCSVLQHSHLKHGINRNNTDVAAIVLNNPNGIGENQVPHPDHPDNFYRRISVIGIVPNNELCNYKSEKIYMIGRSSGFQKGKLIENVLPLAWNLLDLDGERLYYFEVSFIDFDKWGSCNSGDSGGLVYSVERVGNRLGAKALGFIVGCSDSMSRGYFMSAEINLKYVNADLSLQKTTIGGERGL